MAKKIEGGARMTSAPCANVVRDFSRQVQMNLGARIGARNSRTGCASAPLPL